MDSFPSTDSEVGKAFDEVPETRTVDRTTTEHEDTSGRFYGDEPDIVAGDRIDQYIVLERIGAGGMGDVYAAYDPKLDRKVALKVLKPTRRESDDAARRLVREARALARVSHPNVVAVHDVGAHANSVYVTMELVSGETLKQWRVSRPHTWEEVLDKFVQIGEGLVAVHEAGFVHRDIKPSNILLDERGRVRVTDFGLARPVFDTPSVLDGDEQFLVEGADATGSLELTRPGVRLGTPAYMAPEQFEGAEATAATDQFGFCVAFWECLFDTRPFPGKDFVSLMRAVRSGELVEAPRLSPARPNVPTWLRERVERGMALEPADRWPSMQALLDALSEGDPKARTRRVLMGVGVVGVLVAGAVALQMRESAQEQAAVAACEATADEFDWDEARASALRDKLVSTGADDVDSIAAEAVSTLGGFAEDWRTLRVETCKRDTVVHDIDRTLAVKTVDCLEQRRTVFEAAVQTFMEIEPGMVTRVPQTIKEFDDLDTCRDERRLELIPPLPEDDATRDAVRELELTLERTLVNEHFATFDEGLDISRDALERAEEIGYAPTIAKARYRVAVFLEKQGKYEEAVEAWAASFRGAAVTNYDALAADAAAGLAFTEGYQLARYDTGIRWAQLAGVYGERIGETEGLREGRRLDVLATLLEMKGDLEASVETHERALEMRRAVVGENHHSIAYGSANYAMVLDKLGRREEARQTLVKAQSIFEEHFGPDNPTTAHVMHMRANIELDLGNLEEAESLFTKVATVWRDKLGPEHPDVGDLHNAFGELRREQGRLEDAEAEHRKALAIHEAALEDDHPDIAHTATSLAQVLVERRAFDEAEDLYQRVLAIARGEGQEDQRGRARHGLGTIALERGDRAQARVAFAHARRDFEAADGDYERWLERCDEGLAAAGAAPTPSG